MSNETGFKVTDTIAGLNSTDFEDLFVRKDCFLEGGLWLWGSNGAGALADNTVINRSSPVQTISGGTNWKDITLASSGALGIKTDGTLWTWGFNGYGQLGNNTSINSSSPVQTISGGTDWRSISKEATAAIKTDGSLWIWGAASAGRLGNNDSVVHRSSPVQTISGGTNWKNVSGVASAVAAIKTDGTLWVWGTNFAGGIGDNTVISRSSPVQTISGGTNWCAVSVGNIQSAAIKTDGTLWVWGSNSYGQLGDNTRINRSSPVQTISGGTNWRSINLRCTHVGAVKTDGSLWMWGDQTAGGLGENILIRRSSPVQTISGGTNWYNVSTGFRRTVATKTDGTLWAWGCGYSGNLGNNSTINQSSPVQTISGGTNWKNITIFGSIVGALREGCW